MKKKKPLSKRQAVAIKVTTSDVASPEGLSLAVCPPIAPSESIEASVAHAQRLASATRAIAPRLGTGSGSMQSQVAGAEKRVQLLQSWPHMSTSELIDALAAANTVPDLLFHEAQAGDLNATHRLVRLTRHLSTLTARLAWSGNRSAVECLVNLAESLTWSLNDVASENPDWVAPFAAFRLEWPVMGSIRSKADPDINARLKKLGLGSTWPGIVRKGKRWRLRPAHRIVLDLAVAVYQARPLLSELHFPDLRGWAARLSKPADEPSKFLWERLSPGTREVIVEYLSGEADAKLLLMYLLPDLRELISGPPIDVRKDLPVQRVRALGDVAPHDPPGRHLPGLNWVQLAEAFPGQLLQPTPPELPWLGEATLKHFNYHHEGRWWLAIERLFHRLHPEPETEPELCSLVTAATHQQNLRSRIMQKLQEAFDSMIGSRQRDPRNKPKSRPKD